MVKFSIGKRAVEYKYEQKEIEVDKGELILIERYRKGDSPMLCVLEDVVSRNMQREELVLSQVYHLSQQEIFGGTIIPLFFSSNTLYYSVKGVKDIYVGKEKIVERLKSWNGREVYAEFIEKMQKPYIRDE